MNDGYRPRSRDGYLTTGYDLRGVFIIDKPDGVRDGNYGGVIVRSSIWIIGYLRSEVSPCRRALVGHLVEVALCDVDLVSDGDRATCGDVSGVDRKAPTWWAGYTAGDRSLRRSRCIPSTAN